MKLVCILKDPRKQKDNKFRNRGINSCTTVVITKSQCSWTRTFKFYS